MSIGGTRARKVSVLNMRKKGNTKTSQLRNVMGDSGQESYIGQEVVHSHSSKGIAGARRKQKQQQRERRKEKEDDSAPKL